MRAFRPYRWAGAGYVLTELISQSIGAGAFEYDFGALDDTDNPLTKSYLGLMYDQPPSSPTVRDSYLADHLPYFPVLRPSGTPLDRSSSSWLSRNGFQD